MEPIARLTLPAGFRELAMFASRDKTRYEMDGVLVRCADGRVDMATTNVKMMEAK